MLVGIIIGLLVAIPLGFIVDRMRNGPLRPK